MKSFPILILAFLLYNPDIPDNKSEDGYYYFCFSQSMCSETTTTKQVVLFTYVHEIGCEKQEIKSKAAEWGAVAGRNCENENGCTSDLNYYYNKYLAERSLALFKYAYRDTNKYIVKMVDFK